MRACCGALTSPADRSRLAAAVLQPALARTGPPARHREPETAPGLPGGSRFGHDFGRVRVHARSSQSNAQGDATGGAPALAGDQETATPASAYDDCLARCERHFDDCRKQSRSGGLECLAALQACKHQCAPQCPTPGEARRITVDMVRLADSELDKDPTGRTFTTRLAKAQTIWEKLGVTLESGSSKTVVDRSLKRAEGWPHLRVWIPLQDLYTGSNIGVVFVDHRLEDVGGGHTRGKSKPPVSILLSDPAKSTTLLAHEIGHALGLDHPDEKGDQNTIMAPSDDPDKDNPERNPLANYKQIRWPAAGGVTCLRPDP